VVNKNGLEIQKSIEYEIKSWRDKKENKLIL
jgi:hypothetical protein